MEKIKTKGINWNNLTFNETFHTLKKLFKEEDLLLDEVLDVDFSNEIEFLLWSRGWWLLCHMGKDFPFYIKYRLIGDKTYEKIKPEKFIAVAKKVLYH